MSPYSYLFRQAPRWLINQKFRRQQLTPELQSWIYEVNSLTQRLRANFGQSVGVSILYQGWRRPYIDEARRLNLAGNQCALIREVVLHAHQQPLILARSIIPKATIAVANRNLSHLGTRPLGEVIFSYPNLQRLNLDITQTPLCHWSSAARNRFELSHAIWGRRTIYAIPTETMLVSEFFLPALINR